MSQGSLLIVDDDEINRLVMESFLTSSGIGYELHFATCGTEALEAAHRVMPDLLLLDVMMPGMDGFEVCQRLRADVVLGEIPIVMVTALHDTASKVKGFASGCDEFISKPIRCDELLARVGNIIRLNRFRLLLRERSRFEWVIENAGDGFVLLDAEGTIVYANGRAREMLSLPQPEGNFMEHVRQRFDCVPPSSEEPVYLVRPESAQAPAWWLQVTVLDDARSDEKMIRLRDVTESVSERLNAWSLRSTVSHKLRTPLFKLTAGLSLLKKMGCATLDAGKMAEIEDLRRVTEGVLLQLNASGAGCSAAALGRILGCAVDFSGTLVLSEEALSVAFRTIGECSAARVSLEGNCVVVAVEGFADLDWRALLPYRAPRASLGKVAALLWQVGGDVRIGDCLELRIPLAS